MRKDPDHYQRTGTPTDTGTPTSSAVPAPADTIIDGACVR